MLLTLSTVLSEEIGINAGNWVHTAQIGIIGEPL